nr:MAG TPA: Protein DOA1-like repeat structure, Nucleus, Ubl.9A [Caudoviricetes sp.]
MWVWNGSEWVNVGKVQGTDGNYYEYRFARNNSWEIAP